MELKHMKFYGIYGVGILSLLFACSSYADTFFELTLGVGKYELDVTEKRGIDFEDDFNGTNIGFAAYRFISDKSAWGAAIDVVNPSARDSHFGSGRIIGFRPVNYLRRWHDFFVSELFFGVAQYDGDQKAYGYYLGANARYSPVNLPFSVGIEYRYYQDLAYDSALGDKIVDGPSVSLSLNYRFGH
jgi:hypothetical protein